MLTRRQRKQKDKIRFWAVVAAALLIGALGLYLAWPAQAVPAGAAFSQPGRSAGRFMPEWRTVLSLGIPGLPAAQDKPAPVRVRPEVTARTVLRGMLMFVTGVDIKDFRSLLQAEIPLMGLYKPGSPAVSAKTLPNFPKFDWKAAVPPGKPLVGIYHTHTAESFIPTSGAAHRPGGQRGEIVEVGAALAKRLAAQGVGAVHSDAIHDFPSFMKAYGPSEETARKMLANNDTIQMLFDIHRDAEKKENTTVVVNGVSMARIAIIVGMGQQDLVQPHWQQNHAFAKLIDSKLNQHFPGLSRGIQLVEWRYNQHLHPRALLLEVGCQENSREEAVRSIELFGDVLAEILNES